MVNMRTEKCPTCGRPVLLTLVDGFGHDECSKCRAAREMRQAEHEFHVIDPFGRLVESCETREQAETYITMHRDEEADEEWCVEEGEPDHVIWPPNSQFGVGA